MNLSVNCPSCREVLEIPDKYRGMSVRCSACQAVLPIPRAGDSESPRSPRPRNDLLAPRMSGAPSRRSNSAVWLLLFFTFLFSAGCGGAIVAFSMMVHHPKMHSVSDTANQFRVDVVGTPAQLNARIHSKTVRGIECDNKERKEKIWVKYFPLPKHDAKADPTELLEAELDEECKNLGEKIQQSTDVFDGLPTVDRIYERGKFPFKQVAIVRAIQDGGRVFILGIQGQEGQVTPHHVHVRQFFLSFEIIRGDAAPTTTKTPTTAKTLSTARAPGTAPAKQE